MTNYAFLGTGLLGSAFVEAALGRGDSITVWNRSPGKARALEKFGATVAPTAADAVRGMKRVHIILAADDSVEEVIEQIRGALEPDAIVVDHTTTLPKRTAERAVRLDAEGIRYLHCPVFIGPAAARKGEGIILSSGPRQLFDAVEPALSRQAAKVMYLGERPDLAAVYKLCGNAYIIGSSGLVSDVLTIAKGAGVAPEGIIDLLTNFNSAAIMAGRGRAMAARDYRASFELTMALKDIRLMLETAGDDAIMAMLPGLAARMAEVIAEGHGADDMVAIGKEAV